MRATIPNTVAERAQRVAAFRREVEVVQLDLLRVLDAHALGAVGRAQPDVVLASALVELAGARCKKLHANDRKYARTLIKNLLRYVERDESTVP